MKSIFVYMRNVRGREVFAIGVGVLPQGCKQIGCFATLDEARDLRDRKRVEGLRVTWTRATRQRASSAQEMATYAHN